MSRQGFDEVIGEPKDANQTQVAAAADTILWQPTATGLAPNMALAANEIKTGAVYRVVAYGVTTTAVTGSQTLIVNPRFGTTAAGTLLGASRTAPVNAAVKTNVPWFLEMYCHFRTIGTSGTVMCSGLFTCETVIGTAATTNVAPLNFGGGATTATTVDTTVASGLLVSVFPSLSTQTFLCQFVMKQLLN